MALIKNITKIIKDKKIEIEYEAAKIINNNNAIVLQTMPLRAICILKI